MTELTEIILFFRMLSCNLFRYLRVKSLRHIERPHHSRSLGRPTDRPTDRPPAQVLLGRWVTVAIEGGVEVADTANCAITSLASEEIASPEDMVTRPRDAIVAIGGTAPDCTTSNDKTFVLHAHVRTLFALTAKAVDVWK